MNPPEKLSLPSSSQTGSFRKWWICTLLLLATTLNYMDRQTLYQTSVRVSRDFGLSNREYGKLERYFNYSYAAGALAFGWLVDRGNLRWTYAFVVFGWSLVGCCTGFVSSFAGLLFCRAMLGLFEAGNWPCGVMAVKRILPPEQRSLGLGMFHSGTALGAIITPVVVLAAIAYADPHETSRLGLELMVGGIGSTWESPTIAAWQLPFRIVGLIGIGWVALWLLSVRNSHVSTAQRIIDSPAESFWSLFRNRRFLVLCFVVVAINITWRSFGTWLPKFMQEGRGYSESSMQLFSTLYYLGADLGSIGVGFLTLWLVRRGYRLHNSRLVTFGICSGLTVFSLLAVALPKGPALLLVVLLIGFGTLGLFPTYFALTQEVSVRHQGKVSGLLGCINAIAIGTLAEWQGATIDRTKSFQFALGSAGLPPLLALLVLLFFWDRRPQTSTLTEQPQQS